MNRLQIAIGFSGLAIGLLLGGIFVGRATAQGGPGFRRFEYICQPAIDRPWKPEGGMKLNTMGAQGWELVLQMSSNPDVFCFKRGPF